ncbi:MAG: PKD domain-containing protein [Gemmatimonadaceae bacterium]
MVPSARGSSVARLPALVGALALLVIPSCSDLTGPGTPTVPRRPTAALAASNDPVFVGAGDIAMCYSDGDEITAALLDNIPGTVYTLGDNAYPNGSDSDYQNCYQPSWGRHTSRTFPTPGNHEYNSPNGDPYYRYFGAAAGPFGRGYYSYNLGAWHIISLNSNVSADDQSAQAQWLRADLAANPAVCTLAYWHHPVFSSGLHGNNPLMAALWQILDAADADLVLVGHDHHYERFAPQTANGAFDPNGIRQFIAGTGGSVRSLSTFRQPNSEIGDGLTLGVFKLTLHAASYDWEFVPEPGKSFRDAGTSQCVGGSNAGPGNRAPVADAGGSYSAVEGTPFTLSAAGSYDPDGDALTYRWQFSDGTSAVGPSVSKTFDDNGAYSATLTVTDPSSANASASASVTVRNEAPTATFVLPGAVTTGASFTLSLANATDLSAADLAAGLQFNFDCGAGFLGRTTSPSAACTAPGSVGTLSVRARIYDKDDAGVREYSGTIDVSAGAAAPPPPPPPPPGNSAPFSTVVALTSTTLVTGGSVDIRVQVFDADGVRDSPWHIAVSWGDGKSPDRFEIALEGLSGPIGHTFSAAGTFAVVATVTDARGAVGTSAPLFITVVDPDTAPEPPPLAPPVDRPAPPAPPAGPTAVEISIEPWNVPTTVFLTDTIVRAAFLSSANFDPLAVQRATVTLGDGTGAGAVAIQGIESNRDQNGDGRPDLMLRFHLADLVATGEIRLGTVQLTLRGTLADGTVVVGTGSTTVVP